MKKLVEANIEILLQCVAGGIPGDHCGYGKKRPESPRHIFCSFCKLEGLNH